ncbi:MAG: DNA primase [Pseudomonadota bacterium]
MAERIPREFIDNLLDRIDIVEVIETYIPLKRAGKDFQALCPFHKEKSPSFTVSRDKQFYHCFGCGENGSAIGFLMNYRNLEFLEAIEELAAGAGIEVPKTDSHVPGKHKPSQETLTVLEHAARFFERQLKSHPSRDVAVDYLKNRGITGQVAKKFRLGFAPAGWCNLLEGIGRDFSNPALIDAGLAVQREGNERPYDRFRERIMYPISDRRGRVIGFGGRVIDQGEPKYLNSPESPVFQKRRELYGIWETLQSRETLHELIVVEGYMDVIALHQNELPYAVATLGTAVTEDHVKQLFRHVPRIIFCFDGDGAGRRAAWKALETGLPLLEANREITFRFLPSGHDPDSAVRELGRDYLTDGSTLTSLSAFLLDHLSADLDLSSQDARVRLVDKTRPYLKQLPNETYRNLIIRLLAERTQLAEKEIALNAQKPGASAATGARLRHYTRRSPTELALALLLQRTDLLDLITHDLRQKLSRNLAAQSLVKLIDVLVSDPGLTVAKLLERQRDEDGHDRLSELAVLDLGITNEQFEPEFLGALTKLIDGAAKSERGALTQKPFAEWSEEEKQAYLESLKKPGQDNEREHPTGKNQAL